MPRFSIYMVYGYLDSTETGRSEFVEETKAERLIKLIAYLLDSIKPVSLNKLRTTVYCGHKLDDASLRRMFERDKEELREMGIAIKTIKDELFGEYYYTIESKDYYLPDIDFEIDELFSLSVISRFFLGSGTPFSGYAHSALLKIASGACAGEEEQLAVSMAPHIHLVERPEKSLPLERIFQGITRRKLLTFEYRALVSPKPVKRTVEPYGLVCKNGFWYLVGKCRLRNEIRCFKVDRITSNISVNKKKPKEPDFDVPPDFNLRDAVSWETLAAPGNETIEVAVEISPKIGFLKSSSPFKILSEKRRKNGSSMIVFEVGHPERFLDWILDYGTEARIVSPDYIKAIALDRMEGILKKTL